MAGKIARDARGGALQGRLLRFVLASCVAIFVPSPFGYWSATSLVLWAIFGDPASLTEALGLFLAGLTLLALYTLVVYGALTACLYLLLQRRGSA